MLKIKCTQYFAYNIMLDQWENMWYKELKFTLNCNLIENFCKMRNHWYIRTENLSKTYKGVSNIFWKRNQCEGVFFVCYLRWTCNKAKKY